MPTTFETDPPTPENPDPQPPDGIIPSVDIPRYDASINELFAAGSKALTTYLAKYPKGARYPAGANASTRAVDEAPWIVEDVVLDPQIPPTSEVLDAVIVTLHLNQAPSPVAPAKV